MSILYPCVPCVRDTQVRDPRLRAIYSAAHIQTRRLAEIRQEQQAGAPMTQGQLLAKHVRWSKRLAAVAIPAACEAAGVGLSEVGYLVVCTTTGFTSPGLSAHVVNHVAGLPSSIQRCDIVGMGCAARRATRSAQTPVRPAHGAPPTSPCSSATQLLATDVAVSSPRAFARTGATRASTRWAPPRTGPLPTRGSPR